MLLVMDGFTINHYVEICIILDTIVTCFAIYIRIIHNASHKTTGFRISSCDVTQPIIPYQEIGNAFNTEGAWMYKASHALPSLSNHHMDATTTQSYRLHSLVPMHPAQDCHMRAMAWWAQRFDSSIFGPWLNQASYNRFRRLVSRGTDGHRDRVD